MKMAFDGFIEGVLAGEIPCPRTVTSAVIRHVSDMKEAENPESKWVFNWKRAHLALAFIHLLPHTKGEWASRSEKIVLLPWAVFAVASIFGWQNRLTGKRRFREVYFEVPRKNGKSILAAAIGLIGLTIDNEAGAEIYSGATTEKQAMEVFTPAKIMVQRTPQLQQAFGVTTTAKSINIASNGSKVAPVIGVGKDGTSPHMFILDEFHEARSSELYDSMQTGMGSRAQPLIFIITTAGFDISSPCYDKRGYCIDILHNVVHDDQTFVYIWGADDEDEWDSPQTIIKTNPNLGASISMEYLMSQQQKAINLSSFTNTFITKHLNRWVSAKSGYFNLSQLNKAIDTTLNEADFADCECFIGLDMASYLDLTAIVKLYVKEVEGRTHYYAIAPAFLIPEESIAKGTSGKALTDRYHRWVNEGVLTATSGAEIDWRDVLGMIKGFNAAHPITEVAVDPFGATAITHSLAGDENIATTTLSQNYRSFSAPMIELSGALAGGRFHFDGNPILLWCLTNVIGKTMPGSDDLVRPIKGNLQSKIDGAVALMMALNRCIVNTELPFDITDAIDTPIRG